MKIKIEFDLDNDAFQGGEGGLNLNIEAIATTIRGVADRLSAFGWDIVRDVNGNKVGTVKILGVKPQ